MAAASLVNDGTEQEDLFAFLSLQLIQTFGGSHSLVEPGSTLEKTRCRGTTLGMLWKATAFLV